MPAPSTVTTRSEPDLGPLLVRTWEPEGEARGAIVLVHGISEHSGRYERTGGLLADAGFSVTSADLVGCGASGGRRGDIADWAIYLDQVQLLVEEVGKADRPVILLGHSMGGLIALEYGCADRPAPDLLVLSAPSLGGGAKWQRRLAPLLAALAPTLTVPTLIRGDQLSRDPAVGEDYFADPLVHRAASNRMGAQLFAAMDRTRAAYHRLAIPTLVLHGGLDSIVPPNSTVDLGELPQVERRLYPALRHELFNEPEGPQVVADVVEWIDARLA